MRPQRNRRTQEPSDEVDEFDDFVKHISDHNGVFTRGTVKGVVSDTCSCLVEQLLNGYKVQFGELGIFSISITCEAGRYTQGLLQR